MRRIFLTAAVILLSAAGSRAQDTPAAEVSASYSYLRFGVSNGINMNGGSGSIAGNVNSWLGVVGDFGGYTKSESGANFHGYTYLFGPRFSYRKSGRVTPFAQVLVGGSHGTLNVFGSSGSGNGFAYGAGGGVDLGLNKHIALRPQVDYIGMRFSGSNVNTIRCSFGVVFRFGNR